MIQCPSRTVALIDEILPLPYKALLFISPRYIYTLQIMQEEERCRGRSWTHHRDRPLSPINVYG